MDGILFRCQVDANSIELIRKKCFATFVCNQHCVGCDTYVWLKCPFFSLHTGSYMPVILLSYVDLDLVLCALLNNITQHCLYLA